MSKIAKVIEIVGQSDQSFDDAARVAVREASRTIKNVTGVEVTSMTGHVDNGEITRYHVTCKIAFGVDREVGE